MVVDFRLHPLRNRDPWRQWSSLGGHIQFWKKYQQYFILIQNCQKNNKLFSYSINLINLYYGSTVFEERYDRIRDCSSKSKLLTFCRAEKKPLHKKWVFIQWNSIKSNKLSTIYYHFHLSFKNETIALYSL